MSIGQRQKGNNQQTGAIGPVVEITFENAAERSLFVPLVPDLYIIAQDRDSEKFFILAELEPPVWQELGGEETFTKADHAVLGQADAIHTTISLLFADAAERNAFAGNSLDVGKVCRQLDTGDLYILRDLAPTWIQFGSGVGTSDHTALSNLVSGDAGHTQFLLLAGRPGGQDAAGGTNAGDNLTLRSTTDPTKGTIFADSPMVVAGTVTTTAVITGDMVMRSEERNASWRFIEHHGYIEVINEITGRHYRMGLQGSSAGRILAAVPWLVMVYLLLRMWGG